MKTVVSMLLVLALIVLFAQIVLPRGSYNGAWAAKKPGRFVVQKTSSSFPLRVSAKVERGR
jgi:hypothetical protein